MIPHGTIRLNAVMSQSQLSAKPCIVTRRLTRAPGVDDRRMGCRRTLDSMPGVTVDDVLEYAKDFERSYVAVVRGRIKLRVKQIVYVAFSSVIRSSIWAFVASSRAS